MFLFEDLLKTFLLGPLGQNLKLRRSTFFKLLLIFYVAQAVDIECCTGPLTYTPTTVCKLQNIPTLRAAAGTGLPCDAQDFWQTDGCLFNLTKGKQVTVVNNGY